jgi:STAS domain-containing protein
MPKASRSAPRGLLPQLADQPHPSPLGRYRPGRNHRDEGRGLGQKLRNDGYADSTVTPVDGMPGRFGRGWGLAMSRDLVDALHVDGGPERTTVSAEQRPAWLLTAEEIVSGTRPVPVRPDEPALLLILDQSSGDKSHRDDLCGGGVARVRVDGPVDAATAPELHAELQRSTHGGSLPLIVDLTGVTHLANAGVAVLHQAVGDAGPNAPLRLYAPVGGPAGCSAWSRWHTRPVTPTSCGPDRTAVHDEIQCVEQELCSRPGWTGKRSAKCRRGSR